MKCYHKQTGKEINPYHKCKECNEHYKNCPHLITETALKIKQQKTAQGYDEEETVMARFNKDGSITVQPYDEDEEL